MDQRQLPEDFKDFINLLNGNKVISIEGLDVSVISKKDLIKNKKASGRNRDLADVDNLLGEDNE
jgi:hypothetical protein